MKKLIAILLAVLMLFSLAACAKTGGSESGTTSAAVPDRANNNQPGEAEDESGDTAGEPVQTGDPETEFARNEETDVETEPAVTGTSDPVGRAETEPSVEPAEPVETDVPTEPVEPAETEMPTEPVDPVETEAPTEPEVPEEPTVSSEPPLGFQALVLAMAACSEEHVQTQLKEHLSQLPNLKTIGENLNGICTADGASLRLTGRIQIVPAENQTLELGLEGLMTTNLKEQQARLDVSLSAQELLGGPLSVTAYLDPDALLFASEAILGRDKCLTVPLTNLIEDWNNSTLSQLMNLKLPEDLPLEDYINVLAFEPEDVSDKLEELFGDEWTTFRDSVTLQEKTGSTHFTDGGRAFEVKWDTASVETMGAAAEEYFKSFKDVEIEDPRDLLDFLKEHSIPEILANGIAFLLRDYQNSNTEVELLLAEDETLVGLYIGEKTEEMPEGVEFRLCGENNIWEHVVITSFEKGIYAEAGGPDPEEGVTYNTSVLDLTIRIENSLLTLTASYFEGEISQPVELERVGSLVYNDDNGAITVWNKDEEIIGEGCFTLQPENDGICLDVNVIELLKAVPFSRPHYEDEGPEEYSSGIEEMERNLQACSISLRVEPQDDSVEKPAGTQANLLSFSEEELQQLLQEIGANIQNNLPGLFALLNR